MVPTIFDEIGRTPTRFGNRGQGEHPQIFGNLQYSVSVTVDKKGVALVSGFSKNMLQVLLGSDEEVVPTPRKIMEKGIS